MSAKAIAGGVVGVFILLGMALPDQSAPEPASGRPSETVFDDESCYEQSAELLRDYPQVYYSRQEAYDGCRGAGALADELVGEVDRRR